MELAFAMVQRGRPASALREIDLALPVLDGVPAGRARAQRAVILYLIGRFDQAMADFQQALPILRAGDDVLGVQRMLVNRGILHAKCHSFTAAEADLREADGLARKLGRHAAVGIIAENLGLVETLRGDVPAALTQLDRAERIMIEHGIQLGPILLDRGELLLSVGLVTEAREAAERAVIAFRRHRRQLKVPEARLLLAQLAFLEGTWGAAAEQAGRAMREFSRQQRTEWVALAQLAALRARQAMGDGARVGRRQVDAMVDVLTRAGRPAAALEARLVAARLAAQRRQREMSLAYLQEAGAAARRRGPAALRARGWYAQALLRQASDDPRGAAGAARRGLRILDEHNAAMGATDLRAHAAIHRAELTELGLRIALGSGRPARVFEWAERGKASHLLNRPVRPPEDPVLARLLSELRATAGEIDQLRGAGRGVGKLVQRQVGLERRIRDHSRLQRGVPGGRLASPVTPRRLSGVLGDAALVEYVQLDGVLHGLSLVGGRLWMRAVGQAAEVAGLAERLPFALHRMARRTGTAASRAAAVALLREAAARLDDVLLRPFAAELGDRPLVVVPTGPLHSVPWSILPSCVGRPLAVAPSATLWHATSTRAGDGGTSAVAAAAGVAATSGLGTASGVAVAAGPKLLGAREEAEAVAAIHGTTALTGAAASAAGVLAELGKAGLVHLAAHGRLSADNPLFSDLLLADGPLVVYDIEQLPQVPHTVVLAACDSGRSVVRTGDELLGLSATFIARGAAQLVASVLPIPDAETAPLMIAFHRRLASGEPPAAALAAAQQELAGSGEDPAALAAAAGFVCLGAGLPQSPMVRSLMAMGAPARSSSLQSSLTS